MAAGILVLVLVIGAMVAWAVNVARRRGRSATTWGVLAFFFGLLAIIVLYILPSRTTTI